MKLTVHCLSDLTAKGQEKIQPTMFTSEQLFPLVEFLRIQGSVGDSKSCLSGLIAVRSRFLEA